MIFTFSRYLPQYYMSTNSQRGHIYSEMTNVRCVLQFFTKRAVVFKSSRNCQYNAYDQYRFKEIIITIRYAPVLRFVLLLVEMLKTLNKEIDPHHSGFAVTARDDDNVQTVGLHAWQRRIEKKTKGYIKI